MLNRFKRWGNRQPQSPKPLSQTEYERLVRALATQANQEASWPQLLDTLQNRGLTPEPVAQWMTKYGGQWVQQPQPEFGQGLLRLSEVAEGSLAEIAATLGQAITQGPSAPSGSVEPSATPKPADSLPSPQKPKQPSRPEPAPTVDPSEPIGPLPLPQTQPQTASDWFDEGNKLYNLGRDEEALASSDQAISRQPDVPPSPLA